MEEGLQPPQATRWANPRTLSSCLGNGACQPKPGPVVADHSQESLIRNLRLRSRIFAPRSHRGGDGHDAPHPRSSGLPGGLPDHSRGPPDGPGPPCSGLRAPGVAHPGSGIGRSTPGARPGGHSPAAQDWRTKVKIGRSAKTGRFTPVSTAKAKPATHVVETIKPAPKKR
jgi:hypothetical protein